MPYKASNEAYDLNYFETRVAAPKKAPKKAPALKPQVAPSKAVQKKRLIREEARLKAVFRLEIATVALVLLSLTSVVLYGKVQMAEDVISIGKQEEILSTLISEKTRLETELEQLLPAKTVEAYVTKYLGMSEINDYQKNYIDTNSGEKIQIRREVSKIAVVEFGVNTFDPKLGLTDISGT